MFHFEPLMVSSLVDSTDRQTDTIKTCLLRMLRLQGEIKAQYLFLGGGTEIDTVCASIAYYIGRVIGVGVGKCWPECQLIETA